MDPESTLGAFKKGKCLAALLLKLRSFNPLINPEDPQSSQLYI